MFESMLTGGHPNSLGNTIEVVEIVLADQSKFEELFNCYSSTDEVVRLRTSNAMKRICAQRKEWLVPYIDRFLEEISVINQASAQWTLAQLFKELDDEMSAEQLAKAQKHLKNNLANHTDWIVLNTTMDTLAKWSKSQPELKDWLKPHLKRLANDDRKSISKRAQKIEAMLY